MIYEYPDTSTFRYRVYNIHQALQKSDEWRAVYFFKEEFAYLVPYIKKINLIILVRFRWCTDLDNLINQAKAAKIPILFDVDDLVFDINQIPLMTNTLNVDMKAEDNNNYWFSYVGRLGLTASKTDGFTTTNAFLGDLLQQKFNKPYWVIRNSLNDEQCRVSEQCRQIKDRQKSRRPYTIGYFSGTPSHINDFSLIYMEIIEILKEFNDISLNVVGFMEFPLELKPYIASGRIKSLPLVDFIELQRLIAEVDINIAPLVHNTFTQCKSELKFFEAAMVKTITLSTPTYTFNQCIKDGENGFLCQQGDWYDRLKSIYLHQCPVEQIVDRAYQYASDHYQGEIVRQEIENNYNQAVVQTRQP